MRASAIARGKPESIRQKLSRWVLTPALAVALCTFIKELAPHVLGYDVPFLLYFVAITASAYHGGKIAGLVSTILAALTSTYLFLPPYRTFALHEPAIIARLLTFCAEGILIAVVTGALREAQARAHRRADQAELARLSLSTTLISIGDAVIVTDGEARVTLMNPAAERLTGWSTADARALPVSQVFVVENDVTGERMENPVTTALRERKVASLAVGTLLVRRDGTRTAVEDSAAPIPDASGHAAGVVLVFRDVTERTRIDQRRAFLGEATRVLGSSLDFEDTLHQITRLSVPTLADAAMIYTKDHDGQLGRRIALLHSNLEQEPTLRRLFAAEAESPFSDPIEASMAEGGSRVVKVGSPADLEEIARSPAAAELLRQLSPKAIVFLPLLARGKHAATLVLFRISNDGEGAASALPFLEDFAARAAVAVDNARLFAAEHAARTAAAEASRAKDEFLGMVSHELRTPLNAILGWSAMLSSGKLDEAATRRALATVDRNARAQAKLVEDLLDVSRIVSGKLALDVRPTEMAAILDAAIESIRPAASAKHLDVSVAMTPHLGKVAADPARLQQVLWNLLSNAVKFAHDDGRIAVEAQSCDGQIEVTISDDGPGVDPGFLPFIFERFRQADSSTTRKHGGLGLGLAICRHLVEMHGGTISARSDGLGKGASFTVCLPRARTSGDELRITSHPDGNGDGLRGLRVLLVEDDPDGRELLGAMIADCGAVPLIAGSVPEAMELLSRSDPDLLVSDIGLPGQDGYELMRRVRAEGQGRVRGIPAVAVTALARDEDRKRALDSGFQRHVSKPVDLHALRSALSDLAGLLHGRPV
jgi:PAS domain S-box-containing protein